jgi:hypothetical protein
MTLYNFSTFSTGLRIKLNNHEILQAALRLKWIAYTSVLSWDTKTDKLKDWEEIKTLTRIHLRIILVKLLGINWSSEETVSIPQVTKRQ